MSVSFSGNGYLQRGAGPSLGSSFTVFFWYKPTNLTQTSAPFSVGGWAAGREASVIQVSGNLRAQQRTNPDSTNAQTTLPTGGGWLPIMGQFSTGGRHITAGVGGSRVVQNLASWDLVGWDTLRIGARGFEDGLFVSGDIAECAIWSGNLDTAAFALLASGEPPENVVPGSLIEHWRLLDASDIAGLNGFALTATNVTTGADHPISRAAGSPPQGTVTISNVTPAETTASVTYSYNDTDQTGFEFRLDAGTAASLGASPATITGLTASTTYNLEVRAINANGAGAWSLVSTFTTSAVVASGVTVTAPLKNNTGTVLANQTGITVAVLQASNLASVNQQTGVTTNASGVLPLIESASIVAGTNYHVAIKLADGSVGITGPIVAS